jgi:hypothetical protein
MQAIPFALSVHHFISSVGADAGFAAFIAVALLVLLYFSQARETSNLRRRADEAGQRIEELEGELYALSEQVSALPAEISVRAAGPRVATAHGYVPAPAPAGVDGLTMPPAAPAGVGAPSLAAATRLIPDPTVPAGEREAATVGLVDRPDDQATEAHPAPAGFVGGNGGNGGNGENGGSGGNGGNGSSNRPVAAPAATMQRTLPARSGGPSRPGGPPPRGGQGRPGGAQGRPGGPPRTAIAGRPQQRRTGPGRVFTVLAVMLLVGAVIAGVIVIRNVNHSSKSKTTASTARSTLAKGRTTPVVAVNPAKVLVTVLNGTDQSGLAARVSNQLVSAGYKKGAVTNAADQTHTTTLVQYMPREKPDGEAVARSLKLAVSSVQPIDSATQRLACSASPLGCSSPVIVTVGSNLSAQ